MGLLAWGGALAGPLAPLDLAGQAVPVDGRVVVLNFWASWCGPCRAELPLLEALHGRLDADRALVVGVNLDTSTSRGKALARRLHLNIPVMWDPEGAVAAEYTPEAMPTTYLLNADGQTVATWAGELHDAEIADIMTRVEALSPGAVQ